MTTATRQVRYAQATFRHPSGRKMVVRFKRLRGRFLVSVYIGGKSPMYLRTELSSIQFARQLWRDYLRNARTFGYVRADKTN